MFSAEELPRLLSYVSKEEGGGTALKAVVQASRQAVDKDKAAESILTAMEPLEKGQQAELLPVLGVLGGEKAFAKVRGLLDDKDLGEAATKTFSRWAGTEAASEYVALAKSDKTDAKKRTLYLRGLARLIEKGDGMKDGERLEMAVAALGAAKRVEDKRLFLPLLSRMRSQEALDRLVALVGDKELGDDAETAVLLAAEKQLTRKRDRRAKQKLLKDLVRASKNKETVKKAQKLLDEL